MKPASERKPQTPQAGPGSRELAFLASDIIFLISLHYAYEVRDCYEINSPVFSRAGHDTVCSCLRITRGTP